MTDRAGFREAIMILRGLLAKPYFCSKFRVRAEEAILSLFHVIFFLAQLAEAPLRAILASRH